MKNLGTVILSTAILLSACGNNDSESTDKKEDNKVSTSEVKKEDESKATNTEKSSDKEVAQDKDLYATDLFKEKDRLFYVVDEIKDDRGASLVKGVIHTTGKEIAYFNFTSFNEKPLADYLKIDPKNRLDEVKKLFKKDKVENIKSSNPNTEKSFADELKKMDLEAGKYKDIHMYYYNGSNNEMYDPLVINMTSTAISDENGSPKVENKGEPYQFSEGSYRVDVGKTPFLSMKAKNFSDLGYIMTEVSPDAHLLLTKRENDKNIDKTSNDLEVIKTLK